MSSVAEHVIKRSFNLFGFNRNKYDKFRLQMGQDDNSLRALDSFVNDVECQAIYMLPTASDVFVCVIDCPSIEKLKKKIIVAYKSKLGLKLSIENVHSVVMFTEFGRNVLDNLNGVCHSVFQSILNNPRNQKHWSELINRDFMDKFNVFLSSLTVTAGLVEGKTCLPCPPADSTYHNENNSNTILLSSQAKDRIHQLEGYIVIWTQQIKTLLVQDPERLHGHGEPLLELSFWRNRLDNLKSVLVQLEQFRPYIAQLQRFDSSYPGPFVRLQDEIVQASVEAEEICRFLAPLSSSFVKLSSDSIEFSKIEALFDPILHQTLLIWKHSQFYSSPVRLVLLLRLVCNSLIKQSQRFVSGAQIFALVNNEEAGEALLRLETVLSMCSRFRDKYHLYTEISAQQGRSSGGWKIQHAAVFNRLGEFTQRVGDLTEFVNTVIQYTRLEKIEIGGGAKGPELSKTIAKLFENFKAAVTLFQAASVDHDVMGSNIEFGKNYGDFQSSVNELDKRLCFLIATGFDDMDTLNGRLKLIDSFEGMWERPLLRDEFERRFQALLVHYKMDLRNAHTMYVRERASVGTGSYEAPVDLNLPPIAAAVYWAKSLLQTVNEPLLKIQGYCKFLSLDTKPDELKEVEKLNQSIASMLTEYMHQMFALWESDQIAPALEQLKLHLLVANTSESIRINFHPSIEQLFQEVKYLRAMDETCVVPNSASALFEKADVFRKWIGELTVVVEKYNGVMQGLLVVERPLLADRISLMDKALKPGIDDLVWEDESRSRIQGFIDLAKTVVGDVALVVGVLKTNLKMISNILGKWAATPLLDRAAAVVAPDEFDATHKASLGIKLLQISDDGKEIHRLIRDSNEALRVSKQSATWRSYLEFLHAVIVHGFVTALSASLRFLCDQMKNVPLFELKLELGTDGEAVPVLEPPFASFHDDADSGLSSLISVREVVGGWLKDFFSATTVMVRPDLAGGGDYLSEVSNDASVNALLMYVAELLNKTEGKCQEYCLEFAPFSFLWTDSLESGFEKFIKNNTVDFVVFNSTMSYTDICKIVNIDPGPKLPPLSAFDAELARLKTLKASIANVKSPCDIDWIRVNGQAFKIRLVQIVTKWETKFIDFLQEFVETRLGEIERFIARIRAGLAHTEDGSTQLYLTMTNIKDVKLASSAIKCAFGPIRELANLLKKHSHPLSEARVLVLDQLPLRWDETIRIALEEKEKILPLQNLEVEKIRGKIEAFGSEVKTFRSEFVRDAPFSPGVTVKEAMSALLKQETWILDLNLRSREFNNLELLFDLAVAGHKPLKDCTEELGLLRTLWQTVGEVESTFAQWNAMLWDVIDTEELLITVRELLVRVKALPREMKGWKLCTHLQNEVKNMSTVLPLISELHSDTMRDRHWRQLMDVTGVSFKKGPDFSFKNLLDLHLHKFADDVSDIVSQSSKEFKIDKKLAQIRTVWEQLAVEFDLSREDSVPLLANVGSVVEVLEAHSLEITGMAAQGRFIEFCKPEVDKWSAALSRVESVLNVWQKVQRNWCRLEPIFMLSDDIRAQLPEDSKRFESMDKEWKELMTHVPRSGRETASTPLIVDICCSEGRLELLIRLNEQIEICEKALNDYLEQKKKVFPRFYFVANQALLDILSNGNRPLKVAEYLGDCFDGIRSLEFAPDGKTVSGMFSKDTEFVKFGTEMVLEGPVEQYLCGLESHVRCQLRDILDNARSSADNWEIDNPRELWLQEFPTQLALVASQIVWTEETTRAFEELEGGSESVMKDYKRVCDDRIEKLIKQVQTPLGTDLRNKIITLITIDVHARDMIEKFVQLKLSDSTAFQWQSQLRFYWTKSAPGLVSHTSEELKTCLVRICDWTTVYGYEYVGNCGRLVITPLTDRCYLTLTQALNLIMGAAPAGPAGTGKTETTKDLSRGVGVPIVVFNCSDQMSYLSMGMLFRGLAQMGAWGCFDEFNRISIEVLSVVTTQVKSILDAIRENTPRFLFMDDDIKLVKTTGFFITMNPGYAGRTELPESLKALFRSCSMIVPDLTYICENMLLSEGFFQSRQLARKFVCLYSLCKELLSAQMHYDWGLRAVKSLLRQAGALKRADPAMNEYSILMRALRDFNTPKIVTEDLPIFLRLISDLFPNVSAEAKSSADVERVVVQVTRAKGLQADPGFVTKVVGLLDILGVRHCCFIIGPPGSAKTQVWKILMETLRVLGEDGQFETLNPKAITSDELYGIMTKTKEWKDGAISVIMRNMSKETGGYKASHKHKWIVLDGDIDAKWIESMNTVMDDNKVLTLVSNERIPFTPSMRMLLEIQDMLHASPATVSRGGVLFINESDIGWKPFVESWRDRLENPIAQSSFYLLFSNYFENNIEYIRKTFVFACPIFDIALVQSITCMIDALLLHSGKEVSEVLRTLSHNNSVDQLKLVYESFFIYAFMWTIGGAVADDKLINHRKNFNGWLRMNTKIKFPENGEPMDYRFDPVTMGWVHWDQFVTPYSPPSNALFQSIVVSNPELERMKFNLALHVKMGKPVLFCGTAGTGKSTIVRDYLGYLSTNCSGDQTFTSATINLNSYTDSLSLQSMMESHLDKRTGRTFGPVGNKKCIYFIDDLNMPFVDEYETQSAAMLLFQVMSHKSVFDREHLEERKEITDVQFVSCMNPKAGSFMINARLQRLFTVQTTFQPSGELISQIYGQILSSHLQSFESPIQAIQTGLISATVDVLNAICSQSVFLPSAKKFHYQFNLKHISNIVESLWTTNSSIYRGTGCGSKFVRCWLHECNRVFCDRLVDQIDIDEMQKIFDAVSKKHFPTMLPEVSVEQPLLFTSFQSVHGGNDKHYMGVKDMAGLRKCLEEKLAEYNELFAEMNLVLFDDAIHHICRIARILDLPCGHALLVGVGGSGKQSLARLACFIQKVDVLTILVNQSYGMAELKLDLQEFYKKAAVKPGTPQAFLLTDGQIADERFLVYINDLLASGQIPDLFTREEMDAVLGNLKTAAKASGIPDDRDALVAFFNERVRRNLHMIICHSPVGDQFRIRGRKFPALISATTVDVFHPWPRDALVNVATKFLKDIPLPSVELMESIADKMAELHLSIDVANSRFLKSERRFNYTTPKSFLELIAFYKSLLAARRIKVDTNIERLEKGLTIMAQVKEKVEGLKEDLSLMMVQVEEKKRATNALIDQVTVASASAAEEKSLADGEAAKTNVLAGEAAEIKAQADKELEEALPAMEAAKEAVNCLTKPAIQELKSLGKPPPECAEVTKAVLILLKNERKNLDWKSAQKMMNNPGQFLEEVAAFNADAIPAPILELVHPVVSQPFFNYETMKSKSSAAAYLANWVVNIIAYNRIYTRVAPLMARVKEASAAKESAEAVLATVLARVADVEARVAALQQTLNAAVAEKEKTEAEANQCLSKLDLANRLVNGLADENARWTKTVHELKSQVVLLVGDSLVASAFVGYISPFSAKIRSDLWQKNWLQNMGAVIPTSSGLDPLAVLATEADIAGWKNEGLPADRMSIENAAIISACARWPLLIDPQLQGVGWLKKRFGDELVVIQLTQANWLPKLTQCISAGGKLLIESVGQEIDAILEPLLSRSIIRRGRTSFVIKLGGEEIEYDMKFQLFLQSKLSNPHYRPEIAAQCTIVNFIVTPEGLEDQILAMVVNAEKPELEQEKQSLVRQQNEYTLSLSKLEDELLAQLSAADPATILDNLALINGLETTKKTALEISAQVVLAKKTEAQINLLREKYRPVAQEGSSLFFMIIQLSQVEHMYQFSLESFVYFLFRAIDNAPECDTVEERTMGLVNSIRITVFRWVNRGLFEKHKLVLCALLGFKLLQRGLVPDQQFDAVQMAFLLGSSVAVSAEQNPIADWLPNQYWLAVCALVALPGFELLGQNMERDAPSRFKEWFNEQAPEDVKLPLDWKRLDTQNPLQKILILKSLRPDRVTMGLTNWIRNSVPDGKQFTECDGSLSFFAILSSSFEDSDATRPIFFILSPGADPVKEVERLGKKLINLVPNVNYHNVAMGQGQDVIAMAKLDLAHKEGHWVMLQNIHLMPKWCVSLEKKLDQFKLEGSHLNFRCFLSADPSSGIPIGLLDRSIKLTNEPPQGLLANLRRSFAFFSRETFEEKDSKVKSILMGLCHFHAIMLERKKFGPLGYNMQYPFSIGDLRDSSLVLYNYLESSTSSKIPWDDLRYIFGEIMYGGHIVDDWDRKLCKVYLEFFMQDGLVDGDSELVPFSGALSFKTPLPGPYEKFLQHIETMPLESPQFFGLHPNAEIGFRMAQSSVVLELLNRLGGSVQPESSVSEVGKAEKLCGEILEEVGQIKYPLEDISRGISDEEKGPYQYVFLQECECMNRLVQIMVKSLSELQLGFKGELTMSESMEQLGECLLNEQIPPRWKKVSFPSNRPLLSWLANLKQRCAQLDEWVSDPISIPKVVDLSKLFSPQSFLTAIKQICCQQQMLELDKLVVFTEVTKRGDKSQVDAAAREGAFVTGLYLEGARWDSNGNCLEESRPKEMFFPMPIIHCKAGLDEGDGGTKNTYICPVYCTTTRRPNYVFSAQLRTKAPGSKWTMGGVAMILDIGI